VPGLRHAQEQSCETVVCGAVVQFLSGAVSNSPVSAGSEPGFQLVTVTKSHCCE